MKKTIQTLTAFLTLTGFAHGATQSLEAPLFMGDFDRTQARKILIEKGNMTQELEMLKDAEEVKILSNTLIIKKDGLTHTFNITDNNKDIQRVYNPETDHMTAKEKKTLELAQECDEEAEYMCARELYKKLGMNDLVADLYWEQAHDFANDKKYGTAAIFLQRGGFKTEAEDMYVTAAQYAEGKENFQMAAQYYKDAGWTWEAEEAEQKRIDAMEWNPTLETYLTPIGKRHSIGRRGRGGGKYVAKYRAQLKKIQSIKEN